MNLSDLTKWLRDRVREASPRTVLVSLHRGSTDEIVGDPIAVATPTAEWAAKKLFDRAESDRSSGGGPSASARYVIRTERRGFSIYV